MIFGCRRRCFGSTVEGDPMKSWKWIGINFWGVVLWYRGEFRPSILKKNGDGHITVISAYLASNRQPDSVRLHATFAVRGFYRVITPRVRYGKLWRERVKRASRWDSNQYCQCCQSE